MPEPPYGIICNRLKAGRVIPFLGAGASFVERPPGTVWDAAEPSFLPDGFELAHFLAEEAEFPSAESGDRGDLAKVSSYYADIAGRRALRERLRDVLNHAFQGNLLHEILAAVQVPLVIVVTNYDTLVEQAFRAAGKPYDLVVYPADRKDIANAILWWPQGSREPLVKAPNELDIDLTTTTVIYKMHGTVFHEAEKWDNFVITEEDYVEFLSRMTASAAIPSMFYPYFRDRSFLFLGYSLRDWNLRVILKNLSKYFYNRGSHQDDDDDLLPSWAIQRSPSELERQLWKKRKVNIFDLSLHEFARKIQQRLEK